MNWQDHWRGKARFTIFDSGAGSDDIVRAWHADPQRPARLHVIALAGGPLPGFQRSAPHHPAITIDLLHAPLDAALAQLDARVDAIRLHGIGSAGQGFARALARLAVPGAQLEASGLTSLQAHALGSAGFDCHAEGERLNASFISRKPPSPWARRAEPERRAIVLGAGLAGCAAAERLCARGWQVTIVERHAQAAGEASGNLAGIHMPLLSKDDNIMTRLSRAANLYASAYWRTLDAPIRAEQCGVVQLARDAGHAGVQRAIASAHRFPASFAQWHEPEAASALAGVPAPHGAWLFPASGWARPSSVCAAMLAQCGSLLEQRFGTGSVTIEHSAGAWTVRDAGGNPVARAPVLVVANGSGALHTRQTAGLPLASVRGQVTHVAAGALPQLPHVLCREAYLTPAIDGLHSLGASYDDDANPALSAASQAGNLAKIASLLGVPDIAADAPLAGRVGFRCVAPDRLPLVGAVPEQTPSGRTERLREIARQPGLYALLGYASRGLTWAPLAAELLASQLDNDPLPLEADLATALDPARFLLRARRHLV